MPIAFSESLKNGSIEGENLARQMLNNTVIPSTSVSNGNETVEKIGINAKTIGSPSANQRKTMGISGKLVSSYTFHVKPYCISKNNSHLGLNGIILTIPCAENKDNLIAAKMCVPSINSCQTYSINIPTNGSTLTANGYEWYGLCNERGECEGKMSLTGNISGNADNLIDQGQKGQINNDAYNAIYDSYASKEGYSRTQAYMRSFQSDGKNKWLAECMQNTEGFIKDGIYRSCNGQQEGDLYNNCKTVKECLKYDYKTVESSIKQTCDIIPQVKPITCERWPVVDVKLNETIYPNCKRLHITKGYADTCPGGYIEELYVDMIARQNWDDVRLCTKLVSLDDNSECYTGGYYIASSTRPFFGNGQSILPKGLRGRLQLNRVYRANVLVTVILANTGKVIVNQASMGEGAIIDLPFSDIEDQVFNFHLSGHKSLTGVLTMLVSHKGKYKTATVVNNQRCAIS